MDTKIPIVTDECVDYEITIQLRMAGYQVYAICEQNPAMNDKEVLAIAESQKALLITEDKDFGELVIRLKLPNYGILLVRMMDESSKNKAKVVVSIINKYHTSLLKAFSVIDKNRFRTRNAN